MPFLEQLKKYPLFETFRTAGKDKIKQILLFGCGALLLFCSFRPEKREAAIPTGFDTEQYAEQLETRTEILLEKIRGAGDVSVMILLDNHSETVYQTDHAEKEEASSDGNHQTERETSVVFGESGGDEMPLVIEEITPTIRGVAVICEGASDPAVETAVLQTVTRLFSINTTQVSVVTGTADHERTFGGIR